MRVCSSCFTHWNSTFLLCVSPRKRKMLASLMSSLTLLPAVVDHLTEYCCHFSASMRTQAEKAYAAVFIYSQWFCCPASIICASTCPMWSLFNLPCDTLTDAAVSHPTLPGSASPALSYPAMLCPALSCPAHSSHSRPCQIMVYASVGGGGSSAAKCGCPNPHQLQPASQSHAAGHQHIHLHACSAPSG